MYDRILIPLDGSSFAEEVIPYALCIARATRAKLTLLQVAEHESRLATAEEYVQGLASRLNAEGKVVVEERDVASTILTELGRQPDSFAAMTTHGRSAILKAVVGSVAVGVVRSAPQGVLIYRPRGTIAALDTEAKITTVVAALDGSDFSEAILPHAVDMARALRAKLMLVQVVAEIVGVPPQVPANDIVESSYIHGRAVETRRTYGVEAEWEVLHGDPADAICEYLRTAHDTMLAMSSHSRAALGRTLFGSVAGECVRRAGVPILVYHPRRNREQEPAAP
jgi:nucleotide-binding universal stress UspA family protein